MLHKKHLQLGIPIGTATHRLRKLLLYQLAHKLDLNHCLRCREAIDSPDDLGIDHREPRLDVSARLFWDLSNVAFSHKRCNSMARRSIAGRKLGPSPLRRVGLPGTAWCDRHKEFFPIENFNRNRAKWNGVQSFCKFCVRARLRDARQKASRQLALPVTPTDSK
jgi:hypothetical protein